MCGMHVQGQFTPILEADICGFLYHLIIVNGLCTLDNIHLETRVQGSHSPNDKFDIAIGAINNPLSRRPVVIPDLVGESKMFPIGFDDQQHNVHFLHVLNDDLRKLGQLNYPGATKLEILYDERDYLRGKCRGVNRDKMIMDTRNTIAPGAHIIFARKIKNNWSVTVC